MPSKGASVLDGLADDAPRVGADTLELEYKDRHEEIVAINGNVAVWDRAVPYQLGAAGRPSSMLGCSTPGVPLT